MTDKEIENQDQSFAKIGEQYQRYAKIGEQYQGDAEIEEQNQYCAKIGKQNQYCAKIGEQDIRFLTLTKDAELTELIKQQSEGEKPLSWSELVRWVAGNPEEAKAILGK